MIGIIKTGVTAILVTIMTQNMNQDIIVITIRVNIILMIDMEIMIAMVAGTETGAGTEIGGL